jgi:hypothetical protein
MINFQLALNFKTNEEHLLSKNYLGPFYYVRCFMNLIIADTENIRYLMYPMIKIYKTGIFHLSFTIFSEHECNVTNEKDILDEGVNLFEKKFNSVKIPIQLGKKCLVDNGISKVLDESIEDFSESDESFNTLDLVKYYKDAYFNLDFIKNYIFSILELEVNRGKKKSFNMIGNYWIGRPVVFLEDIKITGKEKKSLISNLLARTIVPKKSQDKFFEKNLRAFEDYDFYANEAVSLIINNITYNKKEFENTICSRIIIEEETLNIYLLYKRQLERMDFVEDFQQILEEREFVMHLKEVFYRKSHFGKIDEQINYILNEKLNLSELQNLLSEKIDIRSKIVENKRGEKREEYQNFTTSLFGILGSSTIYEYIVKNIFDLSTSPNNVKIICYLLSLLFVLFILWLFEKIGKGKK